MSEDQQLRIGAEVTTADGQVCGEIRYLAVSRDGHAVTDLSVEEKGRQGLGRLVPIGKVRVDPATHAVGFLGTMADFGKLDGSDLTEFAPGTAHYGLYGQEQVVEEPEYIVGAGERVLGSDLAGVSATETFDTVPEGDVEIARGEQVSADGKTFGKVAGVLADPAGHRVTHVLLHLGHLVNRKDVAVPIGDVVLPFGDGVIELTVSKRDVENLPGWPPA
jgi:hypothetical protein